MTDFDKIHIVQLHSEEEFHPYLASFASAYKAVFSSPPYNEDFSLTEAQQVAEFHVNCRDHVTFLALTSQEEVIGFGLGSSMRNYPEISRQIRGLLPPKYTHYFAELGVVPGFRHQGLGRKLANAYIETLPPDVFHHIVMRISAIPDPGFEMFKQMGFEDIGVYTEITAKRIDGSINNDRRLFLSRLVKPNDHA